MPVRRRYKRRPRRRRIVARVPRRITRARPVPDKKSVTLRYVSQITLDPAASSMAHYLFRANDLFDPDFTGVGHQPMGFDQWMVFYNHFTVVSSRIKVTGFQSGTSGPLANGMLGVYLNDDTVSTISLTTMMEYRLTNSVATGTSNGHKSIVYVGNSFHARTFFGKKYVVNSTGFEGDTTTSPAEVAMFDIWYAPAQLIDNLDPIDLVVEIEYKAVLTERKTLTAS